MASLSCPQSRDAQLGQATRGERGDQGRERGDQGGEREATRGEKGDQGGE
jgi:hypothetical protein